MNEKQIIRKKIALLKSEIGKEQLEAEANVVFAAIESDTLFRLAGKILFYWSLPDELPTHVWAKKWCVDKEIYLPVVVGNDIKIKRLMPYDQLLPGLFGIGEPTVSGFYEGELDLIIVPGIAFDRDKNRLGRGKGFYDRFFVCCHAPKYGVSADCQFTDHLPTDSFDVKMDKVFTPSVILP